MEYYSEIESYIKRNEVSKKVRDLEENQSILENYWNIGRLLVEAQGGEKRAKYGNGLIKEWSVKFTEKYGTNYSARNLMLFRQFYIFFPNVNAVRSHLTWTNARTVLPIKDENKRNYYINLCITRNLSTRELIKEIKSNSYERLIDKPERIELISNIQKKSILDQMKNSIYLERCNENELQSEKDLELLILAHLKSFVHQLGDGFTFVDHQYKIMMEEKSYFIDLLFFNYNFNCFVVVELKFRELKKEDKSQIEFYMELVDKTLKKEFHNKTMGILVTREQSGYIVNFVKREDIIPLVYEVIS